MRTLFVLAVLLLGSSAMAHPHHDCPPEASGCSQHSHPDSPR